MRPSTPICGTRLSKSVLCRRTATPVATIVNAAKRTATIPAVRATESKPGKERKVTDALSTIAAFRKREREGKKNINTCNCKLQTGRNGRKGKG